MNSRGACNALKILSINNIINLIPHAKKLPEDLMKHSHLVDGKNAF